MSRKLVIITILFILSSVGSLHAASNPVGYWKMDGVAGTILDGATVTATTGPSGTVYTNGGMVYLAGKIGQAIYFDGSGDHVDCSGSSLNISSALSLEVWVNADSASISDAGIIDNGGMKYGLTYHGGGTLYFYIAHGGNHAYKSMSYGVWHHVVATWDGTTNANGIKLYIDGNLAEQRTSSVGSTGAGGPTYIGRSSSVFKGSIDEVAIYNRALSADEIAEDYWTGMKVWPFSVASAYSYETSKIEITGGKAKLKDLGTTLKDDTLAEYNSAFVADDTTRGYSGTASGADVSLVLETASATLYKASGTFESRVFDTASGTGAWQRINASVVNGDIPNADSQFDSGLVSVWHMNTNSSSDTTIADAKGTNTGTLYCGTGGYNTTIAQMWDANGKLGSATYRCLEFDSTDDYVGCGNSVLLSPAQFSVSFWVKTSTVGYASMYAHGRSPWDGFEVGINTGTGYVRVTSETPGTIDFTSSVEINNNAWRYIVLTYNGSKATLYIDNIYQSGSQNGNIPTGTAYDNYIGRRGSGSYFSGLIDEVAVWNRALDSAEVADHYNSGAGKELHRAAKFQVRSGNTDGWAGSPSGSFVGPLGNTTSYYTGANETLVSGGGFNTTHQYAQYKAWLNASTDSTRTPTVASVALVGTAGTQFDNTKGDFDLGTYSTTTTSPVGAALCGRPYVGLSKMPNGGYASYGTYMSHVIDGEVAGPAWTTLGFTVGGTEIDASENGLVALWHFNEGSGQTAFDSKGTNNGTLGSTSGSDANDPEWTTSAKLGAACLSFNGTSDYVDCGSGAGMSITGDLTFELWLRIPSYPSNWDGILSKFTTDSLNEFNFRMANGTAAQFYFGDGSAVVLNWVPQSVLPLNTWTHVVGVRKSKTYLKLYFNGVERYSMSITTDAVATTSHFIIGHQLYYFLGLIDEVAIYNRALSAAEVMNHYQNANPGTVKFQCRADSTVAGLATKTFTGPDSTSATFYETTGSSLGQYAGKRYLQYRMHLE